MTARTSYPALAALSAYSAYSESQAIRQAHDVLAEIDKLRRWKAEAIEVLRQWDAVAERFDLSGHLGEFTADAVGKEIDWMQHRIDECECFGG